MKRRLFSLVAAVATVVATLVASSACFYALYQPEEPKCLRKE